MTRPRRHRPLCPGHAAARPQAALQRPQGQMRHLPLPQPRRPAPPRGHRHHRHRHHRPHPATQPGAGPAATAPPGPAAAAAHPSPEDHRDHHPPAPARLDATRTRDHAQRPPPTLHHPAPGMVPARLLHPHQGWAPTGSTRQHRNHPRPDPTLNYEALARDRLRRLLTRRPLRRFRRLQGVTG